MGPARDDRQLNLFGAAPKPAGRSRAVGPAPIAEELLALAGRLPDRIRLGTSSWSFPGWSGIVYDGDFSKARLAKEGLAAYAAHPLLRTVGLDRTFYAPMAAEDLATLADSVPEDFRFLVKACGDCTTPWTRDASGRPNEANELYLDPGFARDYVVGPFVEGLADRAGVLVFQFPPQGAHRSRTPARFAEQLAGFMEDLPKGPPYAVELRDNSLFGREYLDALAATGVGHCLNVHPRMPPLLRQAEAVSEARGPLVVRWMLHAGLAYEQAIERYEPFSRLVDEDPETRRSLADLSTAAATAGRDVIVVANNKAEGSAPLGLIELARAIVEG